MKIPKTVRTYCKHCKKHTEMAISVAKKKERGSLKRGSIQRSKKRGLGRGFGNLGKYGSKPAISKFKRTGAKQSKKVDFRYKCKECGKITVQNKGIRMKKVVFE